MRNWLDIAKDLANARIDQATGKNAYKTEDIIAMALVSIAVSLERIEKHLEFRFGSK